MAAIKIMKSTQPDSSSEEDGESGDDSGSDTSMYGLEDQWNDGTTTALKKRTGSGGGEGVRVGERAVVSPRSLFIEACLGGTRDGNRYGDRIQRASGGGGRHNQPAGGNASSLLLPADARQRPRRRPRRTQYQNGTRRRPRHLPRSDLPTPPTSTSSISDAAAAATSRRRFAKIEKTRE